jgi:hypothetical protein
MGYIENVGAELTAMLNGMEEEKRKRIVKWVCDQVLQSFRNGIESKRPVSGKRTGERPQAPRR